MALGGAAFIHAGLIAPASANGVRMVVTNDDSASVNTTTLFRIKNKQLVPVLKLKTTIATGGVGDGDGYLEGQQPAFVRSGGDSCLFISDAGSPDVAAINAGTGLLVGNFRGSMNDDANPFGSYCRARIANSCTPRIVRGRLGKAVPSQCSKSAQAAPSHL